MAVVITQPDPNAGLNSFAEGAVEGRNKAQALALAKEKQSSDERNQTRSLDLQQQKTTSDVIAQQSQTKIAEAQEAYRKRVEPILEAEAAAHLEGTKSEVRLHELQVQVAQIDEEFKSQLHAAGLDMKQAQATIQATQTQIQHNVAQTLQANQQQTKFAAQEEPGRIAEQAAATEGTRANTNYTNQLASHVGQTANGGGMNPTDALTAYTHLSPAGQKIVDAVESGQMTPRAGALAAQKLGPEGPKVVTVFSNLDADPTRKNTSRDDQGAVEKTPGFDGLPGNVQAAILRQTKSGVSAKAAAQVVIDATGPDGKPAVDPPTQARIKQVFGIGSPGAAAPPGAKPPASPGQDPGYKAEGYGQPPAPAGNPLAPFTNAVGGAFNAWMGK